MAKTPSPLKKLETLPPTFDTHNWADYLELLCLTSKDGRLSRNEALDFIRERAKDLKEGKPLEGDEAEEAELDAELGVEDDDPTEDIPDARVANDIWEKRGDDWFTHLRYRVGAFGDFYPFRILPRGDVLVLRSSKTSLSLKRRLYIFFLLAANLRYFTNAAKTSIASIFEVASYHALESYLPPGSTVRMFGKHSNNAGRYSGRLWDKLALLAKDLKEKVVCEREDFKPKNSGDAGLDLVAWHSLERSTEFPRGFFLAFGQCACTPKWVGKQYETHYDEWKHYMSFMMYPFRLTFIPYCFRGADGNWHDYTKIKMTVLIDRVRLINLLQSKGKKLAVPIAGHVNDVLENAVSVL